MESDCHQCNVGTVSTSQCREQRGGWRKEKGGIPARGEKIRAGAAGTSPASSPHWWAQQNLPAGGTRTSAAAARTDCRCSQVALESFLLQPPVRELIWGAADLGGNFSEKQDAISHMVGKRDVSDVIISSHGKKSGVIYTRQTQQRIYKENISSFGCQDLCTNTRQLRLPSA